jgi:hypothetical protein
MVVVFVSRRCEDSEEFCRLLARSSLRDVATVVYVEEAESLPWYVDAVPTLVVQEGGTIEVYAQDDAFRAIAEPEPERAPPSAPEPEPERAVERRAPERRAPERAPEPKQRERARSNEPRGFDGDAVFEGLTDDPSGVACGANFETLIDGEEDEQVTERTMREWERGLAAERKGAQREGSSADKQLERLMQQREEQTPAPAVARM